MRLNRIRLFLIASAFGGLAARVDAQRDPPAGWTGEAAGNARVFRPAVLPDSATFSVTVTSVTQVQAAAQGAWVAAQADADAQSIAVRIERRSPVSRPGAGAFSTVRALRTASGGELVALYFGVSVAADRLRLVRVLSSSPALLTEHQTAISGMLRDAAQQDRSIAAATPVPTPAAAGGSLTDPNIVPFSGGAGSPPSAPAGVTRTTGAIAEPAGRISSDVIVRTPAPRRAGFRAGGPLVIGTYIGKQMYTNSADEIGRVTLSLYANGEYRYLRTNSRDGERESDFSHDPASGRIDFRWGSLLNMSNSRIDPDVDFTVVGRSDDGTPMLLAEDDRGFRTVRTLLLRAGHNERPSPSAMTFAEAAAEAEAARYKFVVPAGQGVRDAQIAGIRLRTVMSQSFGISGQVGVSSTITVYLLLTDGTVHDGVPVAPDEMDVATSRRLEPDSWGRWRQQGATLEVAWNSAPNEWTALEGEPMLTPIAGEVLRGRFTGGESFAAGDISSFSLYSVTFGPGQQFAASSRGGAGTGTSTSNATGTSVQTTRDDDGAITTASTPGAAVSAGSRNPAASRSGTYRISGWTLEARYGDGRLVRQPFFFIDGDRDAIFWQGKVLTLDTERR